MADRQATRSAAQDSKFGVRPKSHPDSTAASAHDYRGVRILVYPQPGRWWFKWNASTESEYLHGDPFNSPTAEQALAKAKREIDRCAAVEQREEEHYRLLYPDSKPPPRIYA